MRFSAVIICLVLFSISVGFAQSSGTAVPELRSVDSLTQIFMQKWKIPGGQVAIARNGKLIYNRGFGYADTAKKTTVATNSLFRIASVTKPFTATAIMQLYENGKLGLDDLVFGSKGILNDTVYSHILDARVKKITVRMLLQHEGGWDASKSGDPMFHSTYIAKRMGAAFPATPLTTIRYVLAHENLDFTPGTSYVYSNFGFLILGRVIEKKSGMKYHDYIVKNILKPAGITDMVLAKSLIDSVANNEVHYYIPKGVPLAQSVFDTTKKVLWPYGGFALESMDSHGGWLATAEDLVRFLLATDGVSTNPDILKANTIDTMLTPSKNFANYGMGWGVNASKQMYWHIGSIPGSMSEIERTASNGITWAVLFNKIDSNSNANINDMDVLIGNALTNITTWPTGDLFTDIEENTLAPNYFTIYPNPANQIITLKMGEGAMERGQITITDITGRTMKTCEVSKTYQVWQMDISTLSKGIYFLHYQDGEKVWNGKFIKQ